MKHKVSKEDCIAEINRFFRKYYEFCRSPDPDAVRDVIFSVYSVNDKLRKALYPNFFGNDEFVALKAIRNYAAHQSELHNEAKSIPLMSAFPLEADIGILCLLPRAVIEKICTVSDEKSVLAIKKSCVYYNKYVDIYPCIFNFGVRLFFYLEEQKIEINSKEFSEMKNSIDFEKENGYPHYVKGGISLLDGSSIDIFLEKLLLTMEERTIQQSIFYTEKDGMYTFKS